MSTPAGPAGPFDARSVLVLPITAGLFLLGGISVVQPIGVAAVLIGIGIVRVMFQRPLWGFVAFLAIQVLAPLYLAVPILPGLPPFPISLVVLLVTTCIVLVRVKPNGSVWSHPVTLAFLGYGAALVLSVVWSSAPTSTLNPLIRCYVAPFAAYLMTWRLVRSPRRAILTLDILLLVSAAASVYGVVEFIIGWNPLIENFAEPTGDLGDLLYWQQRDTAGYIYRSFSVEMNPLYFGSTVSMLLPYAVGRATLAGTVGSRILFSAAAGLCLAGVGTTFSRGPLMACVLAVIGLSLVLPPVRRLVAIGFMAGILTGLAALPWLSSEIWDRFSDPDNVTMRLKLWQLAWSMFIDAPVIGVGLNGFGHHQIDVLRAHEVGPFPEHALGELESLATADGTFPQLMAEVGVVGGLAFCGLLAAAAASMLQTLRSNDPTTRLVAASVGAATCAYLINGLTITIYIAYTPTVVLGVLFALLAALRSSDTARSAPSERARP